MRSEGLLTWKAPAAMKRTWSVRTGPYLVETVVPSTMGRMSRCTPSRETSGPWPPSRPATLSISSRKTIPEDCARSTASRATLSWSTRRASSSWRRTSRASGTGRARRRGAAAEEAGEQVLDVDVHLLDALAGQHLERGECRARGPPPPPCGPRAGPPAASRAASRGWPGSSSDGALLASGAFGGEGRPRRGRSRSRSRSSTAASALSWTSACFSRRTMSTAASTRSRTIESTSRPT